MTHSLQNVLPLLHSHNRPSIFFFRGATKSLYSLISTFFFLPGIILRLLDHFLLRYCLVVLASDASATATFLFLLRFLLYPRILEAYDILNSYRSVIIVEATVKFKKNVIFSTN